MPINNAIVEPLNPFSNLTSKQIDLYFYLKALFEGMKWKQEAVNLTYNPDGSISISNAELSSIMCVHERTAVRALTGLVHANAISVKYTPDKNGLIRKIYWKGLQNE